MDAIRKARAIIASLPYVLAGVARRAGIRVRIDASSSTAWTDMDPVSPTITIDALPVPTDCADAEAVEVLADLAYGKGFHEIGHCLRSNRVVYRWAQESSPFHRGLLNALDDPWQEAANIRDRPGIRDRLDAMFERLREQGRFRVISDETPPARAIQLYAMLRGRALLRDQASAGELADASRPGLVARFGEDFITRMEALIDLDLPDAQNTADIWELVQRIATAMEESAQSPPQQAGDEGEQGDSGGGSDAGDSGDDQGDGSDADDSGEDQGDGSDAGDSGDDQADGSDAADSDEDQGNGSDAGDSGDDQADGSDANDSSDDQADGSNAADSDEDQGDGSDADDSGDDQADGSDADDSGDDQADGNDADDSGDDQGGGSDAGGTSSRTPQQQALQDALGADEDSVMSDITDLAKEALDQQVEQMERSGQVQSSISEGGYTGNPRDRVPLAGNPVDVAKVQAAAAGLRRRLQVELKAITRSATTTRNRGRRIDGRKLHRLAADDGRIFKRITEGVSVECAVGILVDVSGSMDGARIELAKEALYAATLALTQIPKVAACVGTFPYNGLVLDFGERLSGAQERFALTAPGWSTPLHEGLAWIGPKLYSRKEPRKLLLVLTDGEPDNELAASVQIEAMTRHGVEVMGIGIASNAGARFMPRWRAISNIEELPSAVLATLRDRIVEGAVAA